MINLKLIKVLIIFFVIWIYSVSIVLGQTGYTLNPVSGADGTFEIITIDGVNVYRNSGEEALYIYFLSDIEVSSATAWVEITYFDIGESEFFLQYNSNSNDYEMANSKIAADMQDTKGIRTAIFELKNADFRNAQNLGANLRIGALPFLSMNIVSATLYLEKPLTLASSAPSFTMQSKILSTSVFHWYVPEAGQLTGPWRPIEGRENWTGEPDWWKSQIKQIMAANIDVMWVHLINHSENIRINLFRALFEMRTEGYDVPKIAPFLDPLIIWYEKPKIDLSSTAGKDSVAQQYIRFFNQYFDSNTDVYADDYLAKIDGRINLDTWHVHLNMDNISSFSRDDLESRLKNVFAAEHPVFNNGIYMITTAFSPEVFTFADQRTPQFEINEYFRTSTFNSLTSLQLKGGYWDQNIRMPGDFLMRDGGKPYRSAWDEVSNSIDRIYLESWNEYDEGTGHYAANTDEPYIHPGSQNPNTDTWSDTNDPYEYINTTAKGAAQWNNVAENDAIFLDNTFPASMKSSEEVTAFITVRNIGNARWKGSDGYQFEQVDTGIPIFADIVMVDDTKNDIPTFGGIFRGRPITFIVKLTAPDSPGNYTTKWSMKKDGFGWFGEELEIVINVESATAVDEENVEEAFPTEYSISQNYPNPFNPSTIINYSIPQNEFVTIKVLNILGAEVAILVNKEQPKGNYAVKFDASSSLSRQGWGSAAGSKLTSGIYFYRLQAGEYAETKKMIILK